jgi:hypothetical protein
MGQKLSSCNREAVAEIMSRGGCRLQYEVVDLIQICTLFRACLYSYYYSYNELNQLSCMHIIFFWLVTYEA